MTERGNVVRFPGVPEEPEAETTVEISEDEIGELVALAQELDACPEREVPSVVRSLRALIARWP